MEEHKLMLQRTSQLEKTQERLSREEHAPVCILVPLGNDDLRHRTISGAKGPTKCQDISKYQKDGMEKGRERSAI